MVDRVDVPVAIRDRLRAVCLWLPETREEAAWVGTRWRVRTRTFAHVLAVADGWPPAYARASGADGPITVVMFRSSGPELAALLAAGPPFFATPWRADEVGVVVDERGDTGWNEVAELITESYCVVAPDKLTRLVVRPE
jgi:hypothetical protein